MGCFFSAWLKFKVWPNWFDVWTHCVSQTAGVDCNTQIVNVNWNDSNGSVVFEREFSLVVWVMLCLCWKCIILHECSFRLIKALSSCLYFIICTTFPHAKPKKIYLNLNALHKWTQNNTSTFKIMWNEFVNWMHVKHLSIFYILSRQLPRSDY